MVSTPISSPPIATPASTPTVPVTTPVTATTGPLPGLTISSLLVPASGRSSKRAGARGSRSSTGATLLTGNPLAVPLAPGITQTAARGGAGASAAAHGARPGQRVRVIVIRPPSSPGSVISRFIGVIPLAVWIALGVAIGLATMGGAAAVALGRRASYRAGQVAAASAAAATDQLTGILNRRGFTESAERELERARRYGHPLSLAYVDVRGLKAVNDSEGHPAGDRLLKEVAVLLSQSARTHDLVGRMGGDELVVLLAEQAAAGCGGDDPAGPREGAPRTAPRWVSDTSWDVTIGTASFPDDGDTLDDLIATADRRLYEQRGHRAAGGRWD